MKVVITITDSPTDIDPHAVDFHMHVEPGENDKRGDPTPATRIAARALSHIPIEWPTAASMRRH